VPFAVRRHRLDYAPRYFRRLEDIHERIAEHNPAAARRTIRRIRTAVERLATYLFGAVVLLSIGAGIAFWMPLP